MILGLVAAVIYWSSSDRIADADPGKMLETMIIDLRIGGQNYILLYHSSIQYMAVF